MSLMLKTQFLLSNDLMLLIKTFQFLLKTFDLKNYLCKKLIYDNAYAAPGNLSC